MAQQQQPDVDLPRQRATLLYHKLRRNRELREQGVEVDNPDDAPDTTDIRIVDGEGAAYGFMAISAMHVPATDCTGTTYQTPVHAAVAEFCGHHHPVIPKCKRTAVFFGISCGRQAAHSATCPLPDRFDRASEIAFLFERLEVSIPACLDKWASRNGVFAWQLMEWATRKCCILYTPRLCCCMTEWSRFVPDAFSIAYMAKGEQLIEQLLPAVRECVTTYMVRGVLDIVMQYLLFDQHPRKRQKIETVE
jgi:hypothetical protein